MLDCVNMTTYAPLFSVLVPPTIPPTDTSTQKRTRTHARCESQHQHRRGRDEINGKTFSKLWLALARSGTNAYI